MQVNSVSLSNSSAKPAFKSASREQLEAFAQLDDKAVRQLALTKTSHEVNDKKHRRINRAIYWSIPLAAGIAAATASPGKIVSKLGTDFSRSARLTNFASQALSWAGTFLAIDTVFGAKRSIDKHSPSMKKFTQEHPVVSLLGTVAASLGVLFGARYGLTKLATKYAPKKASVKALKSLINANSKLNSSKVINKTSELMAKVPSALKNFGQGVLNWSPMLLIFGSLTHSMNHEKVKGQQFVNNYREIKGAQEIVKQGLAMQEAVEEAIQEEMM